MTDSQPNVLLRAKQMGVVELLAISLLSILLMVLTYTQSAHKMFWADEMFGVMLLRQGTWHELYHLWQQGIDSSGICFFVLGRPWITLFGSSEISLRYFSAVGVIASALLLWRTARRFYGAVPCFVAIAIVYLNVVVLRWQLSNGRSYGLFLAACASILYLQAKDYCEERIPLRTTLLTATVGAYGLLCGSHILGTFYACCFLLLQVVLDFQRHLRRVGLYASIFLSIIGMAMLNWPNLKSTLANGKPSFWTEPPKVHDFLSGIVVFGVPVSHLIVGLVLLSLFSLKARKQRVLVYSVVLTFFAIDLAMFAVSRVTTPIYVDRYLLPLNLAAVLLICELQTQLVEANLPHATLRKLLPYAVLLISVRGTPKLQLDWYPLPDYTSALLGSIPSTLPVVDTDVSSFIELHFYHPEVAHLPLVFPTDWEVALDPLNHGGVSGFHEIDNLKRVGIYSADIQPTKTIVSQQVRFLVLVSETTPTPWFKRRILDSASYLITDAGSRPGHLHLYDVRLR